MTVTEQLRKTEELEKIGGGYYLVELTNRIASSANIEYHAHIIIQKWIKRELVRVCSNIIKDAYSDASDSLALIDSLSKDVFAITTPMQGRNIQTIGEATKAAYDQAKQAVLFQGLVGVPSGLTGIDRITGGWRKGNLYILAARPGMGKSALVLCFAINAAKDFNKKIFICTPEMTATQLGGRAIGAEAEIDGMVMNTGNATEEDLDKLLMSLFVFDEMPIHIDDTATPSIISIRSKCLKHKLKYGLDLVVVDYLQICEGLGQGNREQEISSIARGLKAIAKELDVPVIALSQLSRAVETRGGSKRPQLSDLRESGSIEQEADVVAFLYRPEYYQILEDETGQSLKGLAEFIIAKHRGGALETIKIKFEDTLTKFSDWEAYQLPPVQKSENNSPANFPRQEPDQDLPF